MGVLINQTAPDFEADTTEGRISFHDWIGDSWAYPMTTGRNFDEVLRVIDSLQLTANHKVATPVNWKPGDDAIIAGSVSNDEAKEIFGDWKSPKPYIRIVPQPQ
jgi:alkyl hydroperoxide reductase subunit AhpC